MNSHTEKQELRKKIKSLLAQNTDTSLYTLDHIFSWPFYQQATYILAYVALKSELSLTPIIETSIKDGKTVYIPKVNTHTNTMDFYRLDNSFPWQKQVTCGYYGILEPKDNLQIFDYRNFTELLLFFFPGMAFSLQGDRLGKGKGFYDTYYQLHMDFLKTQPHITVGACFDFQIQDTIPKESHDISVSYLLTPTNLYKCQ